MKDELRNIISGKSQVSNGAIIQTIAGYLKRSSETSEVAKNEKHFKKQETKTLINFISQNNLWVANIDTSKYISEEAEQKVYFMTEKFYKD
jgi:hypothetical protein